MKTLSLKKFMDFLFTKNIQNVGEHINQLNEVRISKSRKIKEEIIININRMVGLAFIVFLFLILYYSIIIPEKKLPEIVMNSFSGILGYFIANLTFYIKQS
ncbi:MAG: hypothetical protein RDU14_03120 [Melioribacteraceae bacterium]|nr:hypothetical protein [Melioribacteraceae bacterium]